MTNQKHGHKCKNTFVDVKFDLHEALSYYVVFLFLPRAGRSVCVCKSYVNNIVLISN